MSEARHFVAVIGGATAGAEIAARLADAGALVAVIEQNPRPYGKIEDGLPRWHVALRRKEYGTIAEKLQRPGVHYVPNTRVGRDVGFDDLAREWGFSAVVLACGAWRDRPLPVEGADEYVGKGLVYQNPFVIWFNHCNEKAYEGPTFVPEDGVIVVGGGLASIDVVKALMLETTRAKLRERGIEAPMVEMEVKGIPKTLAAHGLEFEDLGLKGCTLYYRRRMQDMPLVEIPEGATPERAAKMGAAREKLLHKAMEKYRFRFEPLSMPDSLIVEDGRLAGIVFRRTKIEDGRVVPEDETHEARGTYVISSIGSIPEPIPGIEMRGELFDFQDWDIGTLSGYPTVFSTGNVVTGKGNIVASRKHATSVSVHVIESFLGLSEDRGAEAALADGTAAQAAEVAERVQKRLNGAPKLPPDTVDAILTQLRERQQAVGYEGDYAAWIERVTPPDLE